jgi:hypothetical protein
MTQRALRNHIHGCVSRRKGTGSLFIREVLLGSHLVFCIGTQSGLILRQLHGILVQHGMNLRFHSSSTLNTTPLALGTCPPFVTHMHPVVLPIRTLRGRRGCSKIQALNNSSGYRRFSSVLTMEGHSVEKSSDATVILSARRLVPTRKPSQITSRPIYCSNSASPKAGPVFRRRTHRPLSVSRKTASRSLLLP